jgi:hypothetical protein
MIDKFLPPMLVWPITALIPMMIAGDMPIGARIMAAGGIGCCAFVMGRLIMRGPISVSK